METDETRPDYGGNLDELIMYDGDMFDGFDKIMFLMQDNYQPRNNDVFKKMTNINLNRANFNTMYEHVAKIIIGYDTVDKNRTEANNVFIEELKRFKKGSGLKNKSKRCM